MQNAEGRVPKLVRNTIAAALMSPLLLLAGLPGRALAQEDNQRGASAGGGLSTAADLLRLDSALRRGAIADTAILARVTMRGPGNRIALANGGGPGANSDPPAASQLLRCMTEILQ